MSTEYNIICVTCKEEGPSFAAASIAYGYKVWNTDEVYKWLGHREAVGKHEGHDLRIVHEQADLPWEEHSDEITDSKRLNWLIENEAIVVKDANHGFGFWCEIKTGSRCRAWDGKSPREAIDAAMKESE